MFSEGGAGRLFFFFLFEGEEIKQKIQYNLICETQLWSCLWGYWREASSLCPAVAAFTAMTGENKQEGLALEAIPLSPWFFKTWTVICRHFIRVSQSLAQVFAKKKKKKKKKGSRRKQQTLWEFHQNSQKVKECALWGGSYSRLGPSF